MWLNQVVDQVCHIVNIPIEMIVLACGLGAMIMTTKENDLRAKPLPWVPFWRRFITYAKIVFGHNFICKDLLDNVLFIKTTKILTFYAHISTNTRLFIVWIEELFCWRMSTSIYIVSDQKLRTGARGFGVADNVTANALVKSTRYVSFKMAGLF